MNFPDYGDMKGTIPSAGYSLVNRRHIVYLAVTCRTPDTLGDMNAVIKIGKFRQIVNTLPFDRFIIAEAGADRFEVRAVGPDLAVAVHTGLCRRYSG